ncbi:Mur ligase family protein [Kordiimonas laminariae]|uniref:Mur ligase family protein n=1 Tax=Kordiimonas laminariae TaxID=2917717 RepID=UPI001FF53544|nr:UDP-N-acetylmuramoyl-tripeptide--D-alanyl-D-alanine ligase [Kordiimonas laminariae]MCK0070094.1 UDP-N-acetylmuramoyl-tripeptide--D-alanyl-D-alanine ligase [Kordiimonas laminariae]
MPDLSTNLIMSVLGGLFILWFAYERGLALLMFFQQEEYDGPRFVSWIKQKQGYDKTTSIWLLVAVLIGIISHTLLANTQAAFIIGVASFLVWPTMAVAIFQGIWLSRKNRKNSKKPLVLTQRAKRILQVYMLLSAAAYTFLILASKLSPKGSQFSISVETDSESWLDMIGFVKVSYDWQIVAIAALLIVFVQALPFLLVLANKLLEPFEERVKAKFRQEAIDKFAELQPKVIAITGSFGKTSTKHILSHILGAAAPTLATPGSVNTDMGITRVIRESLTAEHQFFIVEMGAYGPGSIARLCKLTPPNVGLITAVGAAHYERFKTLETVARAKFEIAEATFANGGQMVVNKDGIEASLLNERLHAVAGDYKLVGTEGDVIFKGYTSTPEGIEVTVEAEGEEHILKCPLFGEHQAGNVATAAATARAVGLPWSAIKGALASVPQIRYRLEVSKSTSGPTLINDAYNSNPVGFAAALETLDVLKKEGGRRILVTPGMVELGSMHDKEHERLGALAAKHCDIVLIVTPDRIPTFVKGLEQANDGSVTVMTFTKQDDAEKWAKANWREGDAVLFENNLPDLYEAEVSF